MLIYNATYKTFCGKEGGSRCNLFGSYNTCKMADFQLTI